MTLGDLDELAQLLLARTDTTAQVARWARRWVLRIDRSESGARAVAVQWVEAWDVEDRADREVIPHEITAGALAAAAAVALHESARSTPTRAERLRARAAFAASTAKQRL